jgi:protein-S-isoprenylcysteine O-methyltransferase Ste14
VSAARFALAVYVLFLAVAFGWRSWLQYRRTGDLGFRGFSRDPIERVSSGLFVLGLLAGGLAPLGEVVGWLAAAPWLAHPVAKAAGVLLCALGFALTVIAQLQMGASWRIGVDARETTALVSGGVFGRVRNPIYSGMLLALLGLLLLVPNVVSLLAVLATVLGLELHVRKVEEPYLLRVHGERYRSYAGRVGRFVPGVGRLS